MNRIKLLLFALPLFTSAISYSQYTDQINSNRPGESMSAFAVGKTIIQVETGIYGITEKHDILNYDANGIGFDMALRYGAFVEELEFIAEFQYQFDQYSTPIENYNRNDFRQITFGVKYLIYNPDKFYEQKVNIYSWKANQKFRWRSLIPSVAVYGGANLIGKNNPYTFPEDKISPKLMAITQNYFGKWVWVNNIIADKLTTEYPSYGFITTLTRGFNERWSAFGEFQGYKSDFYSDAIFRVGAAHLLGSNLQIDASISTNFKETPSILYGGIGFSWRFDMNYKNILIKSGPEESKTDKEKKDKKGKNDKQVEEIEVE